MHEKLLEDFGYTEDERVKFKSVVLGQGAEDFFNQPIGQYILDCAQAEYDSAIRKLLTANPADTKQIMESQMRAMVATKAVQWLNNLIIRGKMAEKELEIENETGGEA